MYTLKLIVHAFTNFKGYMINMTMVMHNIVVFLLMLITTNFVLWIINQFYIYFHSQNMAGHRNTDNSLLQRHLYYAETEGNKQKQMK